MSFFASLLEDVETKGDKHGKNAPTQQSKSLQPQERKRTISSPTCESEILLGTTSSFYEEPLNLSINTQTKLTTHCLQTTPPDYEHGPRTNSTNGPLVGYRVHARQIRAKLAKMIADEQRVATEYQTAVSELDEAQMEMDRHEGTRPPRRENRSAADGCYGAWMWERGQLKATLEGARARMLEIISLFTTSWLWPCLVSAMPFFTSLIGVGAKGSVPDLQPSKHKPMDHHSLLQKMCKQGDRTPANYAHGPRKGDQQGLLFGYKAHAHLVCEKIVALMAETKRIKLTYDNAIGELKGAKLRLRDHEGRRPSRDSGLMSKWRRSREIQQIHVREVQTRVQRLEAEARKKRIWGLEMVAEGA
ncbi:hypothetical protein LTR97_004540 [Elasticomyces elasticus]|uniref:Uncharacterized protein n=1 Tax=Elasticomyces elasticus TaxID=574655 RepID=A0AAN7WC18_9PEZI|nr:hypothetical protein LTR97_004540 [Elasticomyces elasticus]